MNIMFVSVAERTHEIGILLAVGWKRLRIVFMVLCESALLGLFGGIAGVLVGIVGLKIMEHTTVRGMLRPDTSPFLLMTSVGIAVLVGVIVLRVVWVFAMRVSLLREPATPLSCTMIVAWAGMRGVVTLAAAFLIPEDTPHRDVLLLIAFTVTAGTLFLQGFSLPWLARRLRVPPHDPPPR